MLRTRAHRKRAVTVHGASGQASRMVIAGLAGLFLVGLLLGLFGASWSPPLAAPVEQNRDDTLPGAELPWVAFQSPQSGLARVSGIVQDAGLSAEERLAKMIELADDNREAPVVRGLASFAAGVRLLDVKRLEEARGRLFAPTVTATELSAHALYLLARKIEQSDPKGARDVLTRLTAENPGCSLIDEARLRLGRQLITEGDHEAAARQFRNVLKDGRRESRGEALFGLAGALSNLGRDEEAALLLEELHYEMPKHRLSKDAGRRLHSLRKFRPSRSSEESYRLDFDRAEGLYEDGRYREAYADYDQILKRHPKQVDRELINLRRGVCQYRRRHNRSAEATLGRIKREDLKPEALYYRAEAARRLRKRKTYLERLREVLELTPKGPWAEEALWSFARYYLVEDDLKQSLFYYGRLAREFPQGKYFVQAHWRLLWDQYRKGRYAEAALGFETTAREHPESDELPRLLYWGARSHEGSGRPDRAAVLYRQVLFGYKNTYYGRRAGERLARLRGDRARELVVGEARAGIDVTPGFGILRKDRHKRIGQLVALGMYREAEREARRALSGEEDDNAFRAMLGWIQFRRGRLGEAIVTMRSAFPFHISATGDLLPKPVWEILYPVRYWDLVERYSKDHDVDPYLVVSLIRQESTFNPSVRSRAGARGLMQIMPHTGRKLARTHRQRYRSRDLYDPEINIRYGTHYLKEVLDNFGGRLDYALASYNAGPHRVRAWTGMDLSLDSEEFIEEIPFTETRNYVKLVLRNEMLYRRLYPQSTVAVD